MQVAIKINLKSYLIEAWALGMFMISASSFVILFEHPAFHINTSIPSPMVRRMCIGAAMGITAILLIYSKWGKQSGTHMNPAVTLANYRLKRISLNDAAGYILFQLIGASAAMLLLKYFFQDYLSHPLVNYIVTKPGKPGIAVAAIAEFIMSFSMFLMVMIISNSRFMKYTGYFAGLLVFIFISFEAPLSGMSINPARSFGSAIAAGRWGSFWLYIISPIAGMQFAAFLFRNFYFSIFGQCKTMKCFMSGQQFSNKVYHVYSWSEKNKRGETVTVYAPKKEEKPARVVSIQH
jgi:aquaporin Z